MSNPRILISFFVFLTGIFLALFATADPFRADRLAFDASWRGSPESAPPLRPARVIDAMGGGTLSNPVARNGYLYVGSGINLNTWDITDPTQPAYMGKASQVPPLGPIRALATVGDYLYAVWNSPDATGGVLIYSLADPAQPLLVGTANYFSPHFRRPTGLAVSGSYVYLGDSEVGLVVLDASDPLHPGFVTRIDGIYEFETMAVFGDRLLTVGRTFLFDHLVHVIDISNPAHPLEIGNVSMSGTDIVRAVSTDGYAIGVGNQLQVYDLHDPSNIELIFSTKIDTAFHAIRAGDVLYLAGASGIQVWDFATPSAPVLLRTVAMNSFLADQALNAPFGPVFLTHLDRGLVLNVADPRNPKLAAEFPLPIGVAAKAAGFDAGHAYLAQEAYGLSAIDPETFGLFGRYDAALPFNAGDRDMEDISIDSGRAYLAAWGFGVLIVDLADPTHPTEIGRFPFLFATAVEAHGNLVYVASSTDGGIFKILDVSNPSAPHELTSLDTSKTMDLTVRGNYSFLADESNLGAIGGLRVVNVSDPANPLVVAHEIGCPYAEGLEVSADGNTVFVACGSDDAFHGTLRILDTTDKSNPVLISNLILPGSRNLPDYNVAYAVSVVGTIAYLGNEYGVDEVDVSDPARPSYITRHTTGYPVRKLSLAPDGRLFAFAAEAGTFLLCEGPVLTSTPIPTEAFARRPELVRTPRLNPTLTLPSRSPLTTLSLTPP
jgi:hypothetical protein